MRNQVFEIEFEVPDDSPEFETRLIDRVANKGEWVLVGTGPIRFTRAVGLAGHRCYVAIPKTFWRDATKQDVVDQLSGAKSFDWRFSDHANIWVDNRGVCCGFNPTRGATFIDEALGAYWRYAQVKERVQ